MHKACPQLAGGRGVGCGGNLQPQASTADASRITQRTAIFTGLIELFPFQGDKGLRWEWGISTAPRFDPG